MPLSAADLTTLGDTPITIRSTAFANVYPRLDGSGVTSSTDYGGGKVNCQFNAGANEKYKVRAQTDGSYSFESAAFPNVYLRLDGSGVTSNVSTGGGQVNCQFSAGAYEKFVLNMADQDVAFVIQRQEQNMWCWDATSVSVAKFYDPATMWTQCTLANAELNRNDCCVAPGAVSPCNQGRWPDTALQRIGHLNERLNNALTTAQLGAEIAKSAPVVVNIAWQGGGGHIVALRGRSLRDGAEWVKVADPWEGNSEILVSYDEFRNRYQGTGTWNVSYKTKR